MIRDFKSKLAQDIFDGVDSRYSRKLPKDLHGKAQRLLDQLNASTRIDTLKIPPSNMLESLKGDLRGFYSIRINKQWRIIFRWAGSDALNV